MEIKIQSIHFDATEKLEAFIQKKAEKLQKSFDSETSNSTQQGDKHHRPCARTETLRGENMRLF